jgi:hypothetical protein
MLCEIFAEKRKFVVLSLLVYKGWLKEGGAGRRKAEEEAERKKTNGKLELG